MSYLVDTSWIIEYLRNNPLAHDRLRTFRDEGLYVSVITLAELYRGVFRSNNPERTEHGLQDFIQGVTVLEITSAIARLFGELDASLRRRGTAVAELDLLIAATALQHDLTLLTKDSDFDRVENLRTISL